MSFVIGTRLSEARQDDGLEPLTFDSSWPLWNRLKHFVEKRANKFNELPQYSMELLAQGKI